MLLGQPSYVYKLESFFLDLSPSRLWQLRTVNQGRDVRLRDERELRHTQQMSLLSHGDVLSTLPPEAAARLVNANYTLCTYRRPGVFFENVSVEILF